MWQFLKIVTFLAFYFCGSNFLAQTGFKKTYYLQNSLSSTSCDIIEIPNGELVMIGLTNGTLNGSISSRLTAVGTDASGNQLWRKSYGNSKFGYLYNPLISRGGISDNSGIYYSCSVRDSLNAYYSVLVKFNFSGDTLWQRTYKDSMYDLFSQSVCKTTDGGLLLCGYLQKNNAQNHPLYLL